MTLHKIKSPFYAMTNNLFTSEHDSYLREERLISSRAVVWNIIENLSY